jgi:hypothetical protein
MRTAVGRRTLLAAAVAAVGSELLAVPEIVERPRLITVAAVVVVLLLLAPTPSHHHHHIRQQRR